MSGYVFAGLDVRLENPAGLTGLWAEENTRESLFDAMQRKETFATSGPHIKVRFFGGSDWADIARPAGLGQDRLCRRRADGWRPAAAARGQGAVLRRLGGQGSDLG